MLSRIHRLALRQDVHRVLTRGRAVHSPFLMVKILSTRNAFWRATVVAGLKVHAHAVRRNRVKRRLREILRKYSAAIVPGVDVVMVAKAGAAGKTFQELKAAVERMLRVARVMR